MKVELGSRRSMVSRSVAATAALVGLVGGGIEFLEPVTDAEYNGESP